MPDLHACIKALAEMERPCREGTTVLGQDTHMSTCPGGCGGTGRIVLFKGLRVECKIYEFDGALLHVAAQHEHSPHGCPGWVPEPDVEKACWRVWKEISDATDGMSLWERDGEWFVMDDQDVVAKGKSAEEAVLQAAPILVGEWEKALAWAQAHEHD